MLFLLVKCGVKIKQEKMGYASSLTLAACLCFLVAVEQGVGLPTEAQVKGQCIYKHFCAENRAVLSVKLLR